VETMLDFDPQLRDLPLVFDLAAIAQLFEDQWPAPTDTDHARIRVQSCRLQDTKYQPLVRCVTTYELRVAHPGEAPWPTIGQVEITPAGPAHRLFTADPILPQLVAANDPAQMRARFGGLLAESAAAGSVEDCTITPIRYKPGARCVLRYDIRSAAGPQVFFGKLLARDADRLMTILSTLHDLSQVTAGMPDVLRPLAYWPDLQMVVQPEVRGGAELNTLAFDWTADSAVREQWLHAAGAALAALHHSAGAAGPQRTLQDDLAELQEYRAPMGQVRPALAERYATLSDALATHSAGTAPPARVASHGAFRPDQFMIEAGRLVMIDLDSFCWAAPARDIGNFLAYLRWKAIRSPERAGLLQHAGQVFLEGYAAGGPAVDARESAIYQAASLLKIAGRRFRSLSLKEWPLVPRLLDAAGDLLADEAATWAG
jgi:hypothetical protein